MKGGDRGGSVRALERQHPSRDHVLTEKEVADALQISVDKVLKADLPTIYFGRDKRYVWGVVLDVLAERAKNDSG